MNIKFGYPEALLIFAGIVSSTNFNLCISALVLSVLSSIVRGSLEYNEKIQAKEELRDGAKVLTDALTSVIKPKNDNRKLH